MMESAPTCRVDVVVQVLPPPPLSTLANSTRESIYKFSLELQRAWPSHTVGCCIRSAGCQHTYIQIQTRRRTQIFTHTDADFTVSLGRQESRQSNPSML